MRRRNATIAVTALLTCACLTDLESPSPETFACEPGSDIQQCPATHFCDTQSCVARLSCSAPTDQVSLCSPCGDPLMPNRACTGENLDFGRCDLQFTTSDAAVQCTTLVHTATSVLPTDSAVCDCPDGTHCVTRGAGDTEAFDLYLLLRDAKQGGVVEEADAARICVRVCSAELDCSAGHTCRPAAAVGLGPVVEGRTTVGVCYPDGFGSSEPETNVSCRDSRACVGTEVCQMQTRQVADHPEHPIGAVWQEERLALQSECIAPAGVVLTPAEQGCGSGSRCESGICHNMRCARLCDPEDPTVCPEGQICRQAAVSRPAPGLGRSVYDHIWLCAD